VRQAPRHLRFARELLCLLVRVLVGSYPAGKALPEGPQRVYFANHTSHLDTMTLLASMSIDERSRSRPVAARDYWAADKLRLWIASQVLNVVFIDRQRREEGQDPLAPLYEALQQGDSLIIFPEGTRNNAELPAEFRSGLFHLSRAFPQVEFVPVYLENLHRIFPKDSKLPVPLINRVHFGEPLLLAAEEEKADFLTRARQAVCALYPGR
jgi:1-acyl-sn-glycerol-3-phosphate acyltransferase